ncbi:MAG: glyoxalase family protein [Gaiellaceae bacterium]|nr:glyoxalase family protein [Gaiellaceae bacterium]
MRLEGLHHVTAITGDAPRNVDFYAGTLGLRMVAKTVNQDDPNVYHLFYADENGSPGSDITFFEYPGAAPGRAGIGMVHRVIWRVGADAALDFWAERMGVERTDDAVVFADPEGLEHELRVSTASDAPLSARHSEIPPEHALLGFDGVRARSLRPEASATLLETLLGAERHGDDTFEIRGEHRGGSIIFEQGGERGLQGAGTIHHIAWNSTNEDHPRWLERLEGAGVRTSGMVDRHYFRSIYFREPGGILYEIADHGPGFTRDLPLDELGSKVILPPWLEPHRTEIEANLTPLPVPSR